LLPASAYLELALACAREAFGPSPCVVEEARLTNPCFLTPDRPLRLHTAFAPDTGTVEVHTRPVGGEEWTAHLTAVLRPRGAEEADLFSPGQARQRCRKEFSREQCSAYARKIGLDYGPFFQGVERAWQGDRESLGLVRLPDGLGREEGEHLFHPALLDAC